MNILLIDDHFCARDGVRQLLEQLFTGVVVFEAENVRAGLACARSHALNLVLLDVQLPGQDWRDALNDFKRAFSGLCVVMFSGLDDPMLVQESLHLGATGFIQKAISRQDFVEALRDVLSGRPYVPPSTTGSFVPAALPVGQTHGVQMGMHAVSDPASFGLTKREFEVLRWLVQGKCNKEIARRLSIQEQTVKNHLRPIFQKFGVTRRAALLIEIYKRGVVFGAPDVGN